MDDPIDWDAIPDSEEGRDRIRRLIAEAEARADLVEEGRGLTRLSRLIRQIGSWDDRAAFVVAAEVGRQAVHVLRKTEAKSALAAALRAAAVPFVAGVDSEALLGEALGLCKEIEDREGMAWALYGLKRYEEAMRIFLELEHSYGEAVCLQRMALLQKRTSPDRFLPDLERASELFSKAGRPRDAFRAWMTVYVGVPSPVAPEAFLGLAPKILSSADSAHDQAMAYRLLARTADEVGRPELAASYREAEDRLDDEIFGSRRGRLEHEVEVAKECLDFARVGRRLREVREAKAQLRRWSAELRSEQGRR